MDLSLWDPPDDQVYFTSINNYPASSVCQRRRYSGYWPVGEQSSRNLSEDDKLLCCFCRGYGRDMIEEDALNEKFCLQALKILNKKADEDIPSEKFEHLDDLKKERTEDVHHPGNQSEQPTELPPRLHDCLKPLPENYLAKSEQKIYDALSKASASAHVSATNKLSEMDMNMPNTNLSLAKSGRISLINSEPSSPMVMDSIVERADSREERKTNDKEVISNGKVTQYGLEEESKVTNLYLESLKTEMEILEIVKVESMEQTTEASSKVPTPRVYRRATKPSSATHKLKGQDFMSRKNKGAREYTKKLMNPVCEPIREDGTDGWDQNSSSIKDVGRLKVVDLRAMAKERKIRGYSKLTKAELLKSLGLEPLSSRCKDRGNCRQFVQDLKCKEYEKYIRSSIFDREFHNFEDILNILQEITDLTFELDFG